jgi:uncharacterized Fe-S radical SAM superfamily protein PflX
VDGWNRKRTTKYPDREEKKQTRYTQNKKLHKIWGLRATRENPSEKKRNTHILLPHKKIKIITKQTKKCETCTRWGKAQRKAAFLMNSLPPSFSLPHLKK